jgi:DNA invertase Pin-like site-specific DNA recombinase
VAETRKLARCAIYTRKSTEHNLDLEFNSLDAQREACEAYIKSQAHEGWRLVPGHFDDGGLSGASLERPALKALLAQIEAGKIDVVVVYKVDRLTRSLTDFARLVELFDRHGVSFVSITQSFNTTTSMGRLTLNVLLSFAQFEREVIGERVRDKIAASKRKGLWMGGPAPLGYAAENKKLVIVEAEAEMVRMIFRRYLELGSIQALAADLDRRRIQTKKRIWSNDRAVGGVRFGTGALAYLLKNRIYLGAVVHQGEVFEGDHAAIIDRAVFEAVQEKLKEGAVARKLKLKSSPSLLAGKIYDEKGNRMTPSHTVKNGLRYRYYISKTAPDAKWRALRVPAPEIEALVSDAIRNRATPENAASDSQPTAEIDRLIVGHDTVTIQLAAEPGKASSQVITVPWSSKGAGVIRGNPADVVDPGQAMKLDGLLIAIAKARVWVEELTENRTTIYEIAKLEGKGERYIRMLLPLAFTAPAVVKKLIERIVQLEITLTQMTEDWPPSWKLQSERLDAPLRH